MLTRPRQSCIEVSAAVYNVAVMQRCLAKPMTQAVHDWWCAAAALSFRGLTVRDVTHTKLRALHCVFNLLGVSATLRHDLNQTLADNSTYSWYVRIALHGRRR